MSVGLGASLLGRNATLARAVIALALGTVAQSWFEGRGVLEWWQHFGIDLGIFVVITIPARSYWQTGMAGLLFAQLWLHAIWGAAPEFAWAHYAFSIYLGFAKCLVLLLWSVGRYVQAAFDSLSRWCSDLVLAAIGRKHAA